MCFLPAAAQMAYFLHISPAHPVQYYQDYDCNTAGGTDDFEWQTMSGVRKQEETNTLMIFRAVVVTSFHHVFTIYRCALLAIQNTPALCLSWSHVNSQTTYI